MYIYIYIYVYVYIYIYVYVYVYIYVYIDMVDAPFVFIKLIDHGPSLSRPTYRSEACSERSDAVRGSKLHISQTETRT